MALKLPKGMNEHYGRNVDRMPELLKAGKVPMSVARFMQTRLIDGAEFPDLWNNYADTSDLIVYPKGDSKDVYVLLTVDNQGKITPNGRKALELIRPDNLASNYGAVVEQLGELESNGLIKVPRKRITPRTYLTKDKVLSELTWRVLARHPDEVPAEFAEDKDLLEEYFSEVASRTKSDKNMALYVGDSLKDKTTLKAWCVCGAVWYYGSNAYGRSNLDYWDGRVVALAPEVLSARNLGGSLVDSANKQLEGLEGIVKPENLTEIRKALNGFVSVEQVLEALGKYVPEIVQADFEKDIKKLYVKSQ